MCGVWGVDKDFGAYWRGVGEMAVTRRHRAGAG
jgi:hypothetical protein